MSWRYFQQRNSSLRWTSFVFRHTTPFLGWRKGVVLLQQIITHFFSLNTFCFRTHNGWTFWMKHHSFSDTPPDFYLKQICYCTKQQLFDWNTFFYTQYAIFRWNIMCFRTHSTYFVRNRSWHILIRSYSSRISQGNRWKWRKIKEMMIHYLRFSFVSMIKNILSIIRWISISLRSSKQPTQLVVPSPRRLDVMKLFHDSVFG